MKHLILVALCLLVTPAFAGSNPFAAEKASSFPETDTLVVKAQDGKEHLFKIEVAATPKLLAKGLMYRKEMPEDEGMLFIFPDSKERTFWMKNTYIPLDMYFIREDGVIRYIHENAVPLDLTPIRSFGNAKAVLEVNGGLTEKLGIKPGDKIHHSIFGNELAEK